MARDSFPEPKPPPDPPEDHTTIKDAGAPNDDDNPDPDPDHDNTGAASGTTIIFHGGQLVVVPGGGNKQAVPNPPNNPPKGKKSKAKRAKKGQDPVGSTTTTTPQISTSSSGNQDTASSAKLQSELQDALNELADCRQMMVILNSANSDLITQRNLLRAQVTDFTDVIASNDSEISSLREELDQAHFKLRKAERRNRYVDDSDRWKADAKYRKKQKDAATMLFGFPSYEPDEAGDEILKERRGAQGLVVKSVSVVTGMMNRFNEELFQTAASCSDLVENQGFEKASMSTSSRERADRVLGTRLVSMILPTIPRNRPLNPIAVQITIQAFLVHWCNSIIEAWYPKQPTFAEFLVDVASKLKVGTNTNICGKNTVITQKHTRESDNLFGDWVEEIIEDLCDVLSIFGWKIGGYSPGKKLSTLAIHTRLLSLVKDAYDIRTAMAEVSTSGDIDLVIVSCDTQFNQQIMEDAYGDRRTTPRKDLGTEEPEGTFEDVVATTGIGLQREILKPHELLELITRDIEMVLRPRVVLEYTLLEAFQ
ncbi:hypothetical protein EST38_g3046 [Candolleomyces aberdarensis]|uniref:Uncharacterized protein n=1 Tax=Candolleomyces aberdarensis TaxID=2316362 RepID=A0A4V1Q4P4_9AGAR|nr:hypothetical protein EST38_g3046 [Candolleomyces aberdarensis]